jgi:hypothetical protein
MEGLSKYYQLARLRSNGTHTARELNPVTAYLQSRFPDLLEDVDNDGALCAKLFAAWQSGEALAGLSLRCRISHAIVQECHALIQQYGQTRGLKLDELLAICLADEGKPIPIEELLTIARDRSRFRPLSYEILASYDPTQSAISTWTKRLLRQTANVKQYLREHGILLISDWALLNDTKPSQIKRMLVESFLSTEKFATELALIHEAYRSVYLVGAISGGRCADPTSAQLQQMGDYLYTKTQQAPPNEVILKKLRSIAEMIRRYRLKEFNDPNGLDKLDDSPKPSDASGEDAEIFLDGYKEQLTACLDRAIATVIQYRLAAYRHPSGNRRPKPEAATQRLKALHLYYCERVAQKEIAVLIGLQRQDQVSRLLKLPDLRLDIRLHMLPCLQNHIEAVVEASLSPERLIEVFAALEEELDRLVQSDEIAGATNKKFTPTPNQLGQQICRYLDSLPPPTAH